MKKNSCVMRRCQKNEHFRKIWMTMKLMMVLFFVASTNLIATDAYSQNTKLTMQLKDATVKEVLSNIENNSEFFFLYNSKLIDVDRKVSMDVNDKKINEILGDLFEGTDVIYTVVDRQIVLINMVNLNSFDQPGSQQKQISGTVTDKNGPIPGANIVVTGTTQGTMTDIEGKYSIEVPEGSKSLTFSFIGMEPQVINIGTLTQIDVNMSEAAIGLGEVVVTAFGIKQQKKELTYSTQVVDGEELTKVANINVMESLQGRVTGISITSSANGVGSPARVILRGDRSINGNSQPLYIIDGVPVMEAPTNMNGNDILSINVLKGANAAALYGSDAQNGVIVITTRSGKSGKTEISLNNSYMIGFPLIPDIFQNVYGQGHKGIYDKGAEVSWGPKMEGQLVDTWSMDPADSGKKYPFNPQPNNIKDNFQNGQSIISSLLVSMGGEKTQSAFSYSHTSSSGVVPGNKLGRDNMSARITSKLLDKLTLDTKLAYTHQVIDNPIKDGLYDELYSLTSIIYKLPRNIRTEDLLNYEYTDANGTPRQNYWSPGTPTHGANPIYLEKRNSKNNVSDRVIALGSLSYQFTDALSLMVRSSFDLSYDESETKLAIDNYGFADDGRYIIDKSNSSLFYSDFLLSFSHNLGDNFTFAANFGGSLNKKKNASTFSSTGTAMTVPNLFTLSNTQQVLSTNSIGLPSEVQSLYAFAKIGWKNSVFLDITGRNDWSSTLPADNRSYFYPSIGMSALLSNLFNLPDPISYLQVRASWAQVGSSAPAFMLNRTASIIPGGLAGFLQLSDILPNTNLRPEQTSSLEGGFDLRFFNGRLGLDVTVYKTNTIDQLFTVALPVGSGAGSYFTNGGDVQNKGLEITLTTTPVSTNDFTWDLNLNFSRNINLVKKISDERPQVQIGSGFFSNTMIEQGKPYGQLYSKGFIRDDQGRVIVGANGIPQFTPGKTVMSGNFNPDWLGGISNAFSYKYFTFSFLVEIRVGGTMLSTNDAIFSAEGETKQTLIGREDGIIFGENVFTNETAVMADGSKNITKVDPETFWNLIGGRNSPVGEAFVQSASNTRLRSAAIGFSLPQSILNKLPFSKVEFSLVGNNLFFIYRAAPGLDADISMTTGTSTLGIQMFAPPTTRNIGFQLNLSF